MLKIRTVTEARAEGLYIPDWIGKVEDEDEFHLIHDPDTGRLLAWGPSWDLDTLKNMANAFA